MGAPIAELIGEALSAGLDDSAGGDETEEKILDAARDLAAASGLDQVTMDAVAARARVGRMTVYRRYGAKADLLSAMTLREARRGLAGIAAAIDREGAVADQLADGFVATLREARENPLLERLVRHEPERLLRTLNDPADPLFAMLCSFGQAQIALADPGGTGRDAAAVAELLVRIGLSFLLVPDGQIDIADEAQARDLARTVIAPLVEA